MSATPGEAGSSTDSTSSENDNRNLSAHESLTAYLETCSTAIMKLRNARDYHVLQTAVYIAPFFKVHLDYEPSMDPLNLERHLEHYKRMVDEYPDRHIKVLDATATVNYMHRQAHVLMNMELTGHPPGVVQRGIGIFEWRKTYGKWLCVKQAGDARNGRP